MVHYALYYIRYNNIPVGTNIGPTKTQGIQQPKRDYKSKTEITEIQTSIINPPKY